MKSDDELKQDNLELYKVAREGGTEAPHAGKYVNEKTDGMYHCAVCDVPLFSSKTKFDSGSGWPSFTDATAEDVVKYIDDDDIGIKRTEVRCKNCDAHLGHVFPDGPKKEGVDCNRFCINSISLDLKEEQEKDGPKGPSFCITLYPTIKSSTPFPPSISPHLKSPRSWAP